MKTERDSTLSRRQLMARGGAVAVGLWVSSTPLIAHAQEQSTEPREKKPAPPGKPEPKEEEPGIGPGEDLMREHGVLSRILLIYDDAQDCLVRNQEFDATVLADAAELVRKFVEDYHEQLEEKQIFPRFQKAGKLTDLVKVLLRQHEVGRAVTDSLITTLKAGSPKDQAARIHLAQLLREFIRMYRPHKAREDTVLFPAFHELVSPDEYDKLGDEFEKQERQILGGEGFETAVAKVTELEKKVGLYDLSQFTPKV